RTLCGVDWLARAALPGGVLRHAGLWIFFSAANLHALSGAGRESRAGRSGRAGNQDGCAGIQLCQWLLRPANRPHGAGAHYASGVVSNTITASDARLGASE